MPVSKKKCWLLMSPFLFLVSLVFLFFFIAAPIIMISLVGFIVTVICFVWGITELTMQD